MKAITLWQPWASFIALGLKSYETRSWDTQYRGRLLIHAAARKMDSEGRSLWERFGYGGDVPLSCVVAITGLTNCQQMQLKAQADTEISIESRTDRERLLGTWEPGRYAWGLENIRPVNPPIFCKGSQSLWTPSLEIIRQVESAL